MKRQYIKCECMVNGQPCGNVLGYVSDGKFVSVRHGRTLEIESKIGGNIAVTCEKCKGKTTIQSVAQWQRKD